MIYLHPRPRRRDCYIPIAYKTKQRADLVLADFLSPYPANDPWRKILYVAKDENGYCIVDRRPKR